MLSAAALISPLKEGEMLQERSRHVRAMASSGSEG